MNTISIQNKDPPTDKYGPVSKYPKSSDLILAKAGANTITSSCSARPPLYAFEPTGDHDQAENSKLRRNEPLSAQSTMN
jgi:UDP-N-acetylglucosamine:LPS N-acetylglucosamine transferase